MKNNRHTLKFSVNNWQHLYSLSEAISKNNASSGKALCISGTVRNDELLQNHDSEIEIHFKQISDFSQYLSTPDGELILGQLNKHGQHLITTLNVNESIFEELKKNLIEYADIDGIHIMVSCTLITNTVVWHDDSALNIISLDYAMRGDA